ncbi:hypothetical protein IMG5_120940 [Ichthyophthirius multifiliis]|uniref:Cation-transporting ATPase n=1 Tax=Ichthyophthirius multifiliis TaxID=5932 RepID=G0QV22_ICHMU|nr:hypothetical protein IMG5_120940 [Ichthyophthirius multifiliis]EGR30929.1 hypothetical protein IMG5_120940 [Ichthyophthirius multifiliis]|eukprot:XP_004032516.1 hypothetical protein IMG5_120940 [Ichthyophthirius multifiliis]
MKVQQKSINFNTVNFQLPRDVQEEGAIKDIESFEISLPKLIFSYILYILSFGIVYLFTRWSLSFRIYLQMIPCIPKNAQFLKIISLDETECIEKVYQKQMKINENEKTYMVFTFRLYKYFYDQIQNVFIPIEFTLNQMINNDIHKQYTKGIKTEQELKQFQQIYGENNTQIPDKSILKIFIDEVLSPFYLFQVFSVALWYLEDYYYFAGVIFFTSVISIIVSLNDAYTNYQKLKKMSFFETKAYVYRYSQDQIQNENGQYQLFEKINLKKQKISSLHLVPGDLIEISDGEIMPCDTILLNGQCVMNESMLTGESIPIIKSCLPHNNNIYNVNEEGKQCTLFAGTKCIETRFYQKGKMPVLGLVSQTSFSTMKGQLVRSILYPKQNQFKFYADSLKFIAVLSALSVCGFLLSLKYQLEGIKEGYIDIKFMILHSFDLITITVPPALPTCLSIGISFALQRLKKIKIYCISPPKVNICGKVTIMCFDKTGTLTEEGLDMYGIRPVIYQKQNKIKFIKLQTEIKYNYQEKQIDFGKIFGKENAFFQIQRDTENTFLECMASCHSLTRVKGEIIGDPLEIKMFESTQWELIESNLENKYDELISAIVQPVSRPEKAIGICNRFEFSSKLQRMSTVVKNLEQKDIFRLHVKGSPEKIFELCIPSTIPENFHTVLDFYARKGFRVLAFGIRVFKADYRQILKMEREQMEQMLTFVGLIIMENKLKPITSQIIYQLQSANIRTIMVTGDNSLTAISVARQCNIIYNDQRVYFGDMQDKKEFERQRIIWRDFENSDKILDDENLEPLNGISEYKEKNEEIEEIKEEKQYFEQLEQQQDYVSEINSSVIRRQNSALKKVNLSRSVSKKNSIKITNNQNILNNEESLYSEIFPWQNQEDFTLAITGRVFQKMIEDSSLNQNKLNLFNIMLQKTQVFARMKPDQKAQLIQHLQNLSWGPTCGMCGDGANDCGALKTADIGISLSDAEASIAAPFTSKIQDISCVIQLLLQGRAALVTSFSCFKFMALYSTIQFTTTTILYIVHSLPSDFQFLYWDLFIIIPLAFFMGLTDAEEILSIQVPSSRLISFQVLFSVISQSLINISFQAGVFQYLRNQKWYLSAKEAHIYIGDLNDEISKQKCYEGTSLFFFNIY